jgi:hypothetical protein
VVKCSLPCIAGRANPGSVGVSSAAEQVSGHGD